VPWLLWLTKVEGAAEVRAEMLERWPLLVEVRNWWTHARGVEWTSWFGDSVYRLDANGDARPVPPTRSCEAVSVVMGPGILHIVDLDTGATLRVSSWRDEAPIGHRGYCSRRKRSHVLAPRQAVAHAVGCQRR